MFRYIALSLALLIQGPALANRASIPFSGYELAEALAELQKVNKGVAADQFQAGAAFGYMRAMADELTAHGRICVPKSRTLLDLADVVSRDLRSRPQDHSKSLSANVFVLLALHKEFPCDAKGQPATKRN
ncbi:Rap1a/Tai family immunity protein [Comamonas sp. B21-038]|uniref:Rap1a/Tai family immunity protein n=1 Tax=Comamonas sp. B21-038 TaxID=2918299 RepID=UPI001EFB7D3B|nr:Rap1a/Tai family immunity protein [Comamonas sp. B21-038]ULR87193.1 hypothetical protein MJ205_11950 [Comamonas sp. B21-038]